MSTKTPPVAERPPARGNRAAPAPDAPASRTAAADRHRTQAEQRLALVRQEKVNALQRAVLGTAALDEKLKRITDGVVDIFNADFCRIWIAQPGDLCQSGCFHARLTEGPHLCRFRDRCLHLKASSGRYTHLDGEVHRRVPFGCYKIGRVAADQEPKFLTNHAATDPRVHNHDWVRKLGLVSFAGYQLRPPGGETEGVLALFSQHPITPLEDALLETIATTTALVIESARASDALVQARENATREALKLRSMIEGMAEGVVVADANDVISEVNRWFVEKVGLKPEQILGKSLWSLHPATEGTLRLRAALDEFRSGRRREMHVVQRELLGMHLSLRVQPIFAGDRYQGVILNAIDVSDLVEARRAAEAASRAKSQFLANMSHEIRTPMTAILGFTDLLLDMLQDPQAIEAAQTVKRNGEHLLQIINDILDLSKIEAGKIEIQRVRWSLRDIVADVVALLRSRAAAKGLTLEELYPGPLPETITTDPARLRQILVNLVGNAVKFTEAGSVRVVTRLVCEGKQEPRVQVEVIDTGIGIPEADIERLFLPFTQADASVSRKYGGTGLGLAISRRLAHALGGDVTVTSQPGQGSTFTFTVAAGPLEGVSMVQFGGKTSAQPLPGGDR